MTLVIRPSLKVGSMANYVRVGLYTSSTLKAQARKFRARSTSRWNVNQIELFLDVIADSSTTHLFERQ